MPGFTYFVPGRRSTQPYDNKAMAEIGLMHAVEGDSRSIAECSKGPDGNAGLIITFGPDAGGYYPKKQTWRKGPGGRYWVGFENDARPTPKDLLRSKAIIGTAVVLRDGAEWVIPRCHAFLPDRPITLPRLLDLDDDAESWMVKPVPEYRQLCEDARRYWEVWTGQAKAGLPYADVVKLVGDALAVNYRVAKLELAALGLLSTDEVRSVARAMIDADEIEERSKKNTADDSASTSPGVTDLPTTISPDSQT